MCVCVCVLYCTVLYVCVRVYVLYWLYVCVVSAFPGNFTKILLAYPTRFLFPSTKAIKVPDFWITFLYEFQVETSQKCIKQLKIQHRLPLSDHLIHNLYGLPIYLIPRGLIAQEKPLHLFRDTVWRLIGPVYQICTFFLGTYLNFYPSLPYLWLSACAAHLPVTVQMNSCISETAFFPGN